MARPPFGTGRAAARTGRRRARWCRRFDARAVGPARSRTPSGPGHPVSIDGTGLGVVDRLAGIV